MTVARAKGPSVEAIVRSLPLGNVTPSAAYRALRRGNGVLIERDARSNRPSRHAFIGLDPIEPFTLVAQPDFIERIRERFQPYADGCGDIPPSYGIVCTFAYDAGLARRGLRYSGRHGRLFGDADAFIPGTWLAFDRERDRIELAGLVRSPVERALVASRLDDYARRLRGVPSTVRTVLKPPALRREIDASLSRRAFLARVALAQRAIRRGDAYQVQVAVRFGCEHDADPLTIYERLAALNPSPYAFLIERDGRALVGASPEYLVRLEDGRAHLRPLAGTRARGTSPAHDELVAAELRRDPKERAEHAMLVDLGRNDLAMVCDPGSVRVERALEIERFSHVMHLSSTISGRLRVGADAFDLFDATFPAGTVTGAPKRSAMELIERLEPVARDFYAGSVAHFRCDGSLDAGITLRSVGLAEGRATWHAAAGIVARSDPAAEYREVLAKTRIARTVLGVEEFDVA